MISWWWCWGRPNIGSCYRLDTVLSLVLRLVSVWGFIWVQLLPQLDQAMTLPTDTYPHSTRMRTPNPSLRYYQAAGALQQHPRPLLITITPTWLRLSPRVHIEGHSATSWGKRELLEPVESSFCLCCVIISRQSAVGLLQRSGCVGNAYSCLYSQMFWETRRKRGTAWAIVMCHC